MESNINFSIIIPTRNQAEKLKKSLTHICNLDFPKDKFEVIVVDNGSTDITKEVAISFEKLNPVYVYCEEPGLMAARHMGCSVAKGKYLCYIDDDSFVDKYWLKGLEESFTNENVVLVGGPCIPEYEVQPPFWIGYLWMKTKFGKFNTYLSLIELDEAVHFITPSFVFGCNYSIRKETLISVGGSYPDYFPDPFKKYQGSGETGIGNKIMQMGKVLYNPKVKIRHLVTKERMEEKYFCNRAFFNGIGFSYMQIRNSHEELRYCKKGKGLKHKIISTLYRSGINLYKKYKQSLEPNEISQLRKKLFKSQQEGYEFHQSEVSQDPKLLEWVLRDNYFGDNGKLPRNN